MTLTSKQINAIHRAMRAEYGKHCPSPLTEADAIAEVQQVNRWYKNGSWLAVNKTTMTHAIGRLGLVEGY